MVEDANDFLHGAKIFILHAATPCPLRRLVLANGGIMVVDESSADLVFFSDDDQAITALFDVYQEAGHERWKVLVDQYSPKLLPS